MKRTRFGFCLFICFILGISVATYFQKEKIKEVKVQVEIPANMIINISSKYDLRDVEYTTRAFKNIEVTSYNNHTNQTDDTPNITATSRPVREGMVAVSRDFLNKGWAKYGDLVYIDCFKKWYVIDDTMHERHSRHIDIFLFDKNESLKIHKKCGIEIIHMTR